MEFKELTAFAEWENKRVEVASGKSNDELTSPSVLKIGEEYGEFINEYLKVHAWQRKGKIEDLEKHRKEMAEEFADIILVSLLVGKRLGIDIEEELRNKIEKVKVREY